MKNSIYLAVLFFILGGFSILAFAPLKISFFIFITLSLLLYKLQYCSAKNAFNIGFFYGLGLYGVGMIWLFMVVDAVGEGYKFFQVSVIAIVILLECLIPSLCLLLAWFVRKKLGNNAMLISFASLWTFFEWTRTWLFTGLPFFQVSHVFSDSVLVNYAPLGGELLVTWVVLTIISLFVYSFQFKKIGNRSFVISLFAISSLFGTGLLLSKLSWTETMGAEVSTRIIHGYTNQKNKYKNYAAKDRVNRFLDISNITPKPELVLWPETAISKPFFQLYQKFKKPFSDLKNNGISVYSGTFIKKDGGTYNALLNVSNPSEHYFKEHLLPYGEYIPEIPFIDLKSHMPKVNMGALIRPKEPQALMPFNNLLFKSSLCFEVIFSSEFRNTAQNANFLVNLSDLSWFKNSWLKYQTNQIAQIRAAEHQKPLLISTNHAISSYIDSKGNIQVDMNGKENYFDLSFQPRKGVTPYASIKYQPALILSAFVIFCLWARFYFKRN